MEKLTIDGLPKATIRKLEQLAKRQGVRVDEAARSLLMRATDESTDARAAERHWEHLSIWLIRSYTASLRRSCIDDIIAERRRQAILDTLRSGHDPEEVFEDAFEGLCYEADMTPDQVQSMMEHV